MPQEALWKRSSVHVSMSCLSVQNVVKVFAFPKELADGKKVRNCHRCGEVFDSSSAERRKNGMARLKDKYVNEVQAQLQQKFNYKSVMEIPKLEKVVVNVGLGEAVQIQKH